MDEKLRILIVDDDLIVRESLSHWLGRHGHSAEAVSSGLQALERLDKEAFELLFVDIKMPEIGGFDVLKKIREMCPDIDVVIMTATGSIDSAVEAMRSGACDYLLKPFKPGQLSLTMERILDQKKQAVENKYLQGHLEKSPRFDNIIGQSKPMEKIFGLIPEIAQSDSSVLVTGETGTGKELVAKAIHAKSPRSGRPFVALNCGAMPDTLLESELFGHSKGAFTGAVHTKKGFLEVASGGTLFLDEIGEISSRMQVDFLRVLEEKKITSVGATSPIEVDFRLVSATRQDLESKISKGNFRKDFYYRINIIQIHIPPLRERKEDIPLLAEHFLERYSHETNKKVDRIKPAVMRELKRYDWPGNVRELENCIERAVVLSRSRTLGPDDFSFLPSFRDPGQGGMSLKEMQNKYILKVLEGQDWNITRAAKILDINRVTLHKMIKRENLKRPN